MDGFKSNLFPSVIYQLYHSATESLKTNRNVVAFSGQWPHFVHSVGLLPHSSRYQLTSPRLPARSTIDPRDPLYLPLTSPRAALDELHYPSNEVIVRYEEPASTRFF